MGKYIVDLKKNETLYKATTRESDGTAYVYSAICTPYTEPDLEQVRKEEFENGYENGFVDGHLKAEKSGQKFYEDGYQRGLKDAWEVSGKIIKMTDIEVSAVFGTWLFQKIFEANSASEAIEKIRQYEQEKEEQIQVGDEVEWNGDRYTVTYIHCDNENIDVLDCSCGSVCDNLSIKGVKKTGKHYEIAEVLRKMREDSDG